jgi:hypothetical protein
MISQLCPMERWPKEQVEDPHGRLLKPQASILHLLEFGGQLANYLHAKGVIG